MSAIFSSTQVTKANLYSTMKTLLTNAGWQNISSKTSTDYDVFYSTGISGNMQLYFQMREYDTSGNGQVSTTTNNTMSVRLINKYTPGAPGVAGTFDRPSEAWRYMFISPASTNLQPSTTFTLYYNVDANRAIFAFQAPHAFNFVGGTLYYIGLPDIDYANEGPTTGVVYSGAPTQINAWAITAVTGNPDYSVTASYTMTNYFVPMPLNVNSSGHASLSKVGFGNGYEGIRGIIDGVYTANNNTDGFLNGDILVDDNGSKYQVFAVASAIQVSSTWYYNAFANTGSTNQTQYIAFQIS